MKKVLMITHTFPPVGGGAVIRVTKFVKYLPFYGWEPIVLTAELMLSTRDESLLKEVSHARVIRTRASLLHRLRGRAVRVVTASASNRPANSSSYSPQRSATHLLRTIAYWLYGLESSVLSAVMIPDQQITWVLPAFCTARRILSQEKIPIVYTIALPNSTTFVGVLLKRFCGVKWVVDFRDVWTDRWNQNHRPWIVRVWLEQWMERRIIRYADHVITATEPSKQYFIRRGQNVDERKFTVITNGFDSEDMVDLIPEQRNDLSALRLTTMGNIMRQYHYDALQALLRSVDRLEEQGKIARRAIHVEVLSSIDPNFLREKETDLAVHWIGYLPHGQALSYCAASDVLFFLLHADFSQNSYPGKMFEYIALQKPILAITAEGIACSLIRNHRIGWCVDDRFGDQLDKTILEIYTLWKEKRLPRSTSLLAEAFDRKKLTQVLAEIFNRISDHDRL